jgi:RNA polymerase sigma-70 factor (ECF subfamily)
LSPEEKALINERVRAVWEAAGALSARQKTVFLLRFVEEMELLEIAETTGLSEGAVKSHLFRAVHTVRKRLG